MKFQDFAKAMLIAQLLANSSENLQKRKQRILMKTTTVKKTK